jgi:hypothetical protein
LSMFPIKRVVTEFEKYWEVTDLRKAVYTQRYHTKFGAEQAICAAIKTAMAGK